MFRVQNEVTETLICAKFGKDLLNISKVIGRKTRWSRLIGLPCIVDLWSAGVTCTAHQFSRRFYAKP